MIAASPALMALLSSGQFFRADLYTITPVSSPVITWTSADTPIAVNGVIYTNQGIRTSRDMLRVVAGLETDTVNLTFTVDPTNEPTVNGVPLRQAVQRGLFDGAQVTLDWCYLSSWGPPPVVVGTLRRFVGRTADINVDRSGIKLGVKSWLLLLDTEVPAQVYQASCRFTLGDANCGVNIASYGVGSSVTGTPTTTALTAASSSLGAIYNNGWVLMTSGICNGVRRAVRTCAAGAIQLTGPLPWTPSVGDTFTLYPGCDKTMPASGNTASCQAVFNNAANFGGMPFIPAPETAV
jgi:uncharacterized phage protein (TIGR02218 family)